MNKRIERTFLTVQKKEENGAIIWRFPTKRRKLHDSASASHDGAAEDTSLPRTAGVASH